MSFASAPPNFERWNVVAGFTLGLGSGLTPSITKGVLFAGSPLAMYRPATAPTLPAPETLMVQYLYYSATGGFRWEAEHLPYYVDAYLGWALIGATSVLAVSTQRFQVTDDPPSTVFDFELVQPAESAEEAPGDVQAIGGNAFGMTKVEDGGVALLAIEYNPPASMGSFAGVTAHWVPDVLGYDALAIDHDYDGDPEGVGSARYGTMLFVVPQLTDGAVAGRVYLTSRSRTYKNALVLYGETGATPSRTVTIGQAVGMTAPALPTLVVGAVVSGSEWLDPVRLVTHRKIQGTITLAEAPAAGEWCTVWLRTPRNASTSPLWLGEYTLTSTPQTIVLEPPQPLDVPDVDEEWEIGVTTSVPGFSNSPANAVWSAAFEVPGLELPASTGVTDADTGKKVGSTWYPGEYRYGYTADGAELWGRDVRATMPAATAEVYQEFMFWSVEWHNAAGTADPNGKEQPGNEFAKPGELWEDISGCNWPMPKAPYDYCWTRMYLQGRKPGSAPALLTCWAGGADHKIDHPVSQGPGLMASRMDPDEVGRGLTVGPGGLKAASSTPETIENPGFEDDFKHWSLYGTGHTILSTGAYTGTKCARVPVNGGNNGLLSGLFAVRPGDVIAAEAWVKAVDGCNILASTVLRWCDAGGSLISDAPWAQVAPGSAGSWFRQVVTGMAPAGASFCELFAVDVNLGSAGAWLVDNVCIRRAVGANLIEPATLVASHFSAPILPPEIVSSLPVDFTNYPQGRIVVLTTDNQLYRSTGSAWTKAISGADLTAGTVPAGAVASTLTMVGIVNQAPDSGGFLVISRTQDLVLNTYNYRLYRWDYGIGQYRRRAVAGDLEADSVVAGTVAAGAIRAEDAAFATAAIQSADINSLAATKITAGTLVSGVIYAGAIACSQLQAGTISAAISLTAPTITVTSGVVTIHIDGTNFITVNNSSLTAQVQILGHQITVASNGGGTTIGCGDVVCGAPGGAGQTKMGIAGIYVDPTGSSPVQVLGSRKTGWTAASGTASRATFATSTVTTEELAKRVKALVDDFLSHGTIGA